MLLNVVSKMAKTKFFTPNSHRSVILLSAMGLTGCISSDVVIYDKKFREPVAIDQVAVLLEVPSIAYRTIARIQVGPDAFVSDYQGQTDEVVRKAAGFGADAVILQYGSQSSGYVSGNSFTGVYGGVYESNFTVGQAIIFEASD